MNCVVKRDDHFFTVKVLNEAQSVCNFSCHVCVVKVFLNKHGIEVSVSLGTIFKDHISRTCVFFKNFKCN